MSGNGVLQQVKDIITDVKTAIKGLNGVAFTMGGLASASVEILPVTAVTNTDLDLVSMVVKDKLIDVNIAANLTASVQLYGSLDGLKLDALGAAVTVSGAFDNTTPWGYLTADVTITPNQLTASVLSIISESASIGINGHGYLKGNWVLVAGNTSPDASLINGWRQIQSVTTNAFVLSFPGAANGTDIETHTFDGGVIVTAGY